MKFQKKKCSGLKFLAYIFPLLILSSCVTSQEDFMYLNDQVVALNRRVSGLQESVDKRLSGDLDTRLASIRENQAESGVEMDRIKGEIQKVSGRMDENNLLLRRAVEKDTTDQDIMKAGLADLTKRIAELEAGMMRVHQYLGLELAVKAGKNSLERPTEAGEQTAKQPTSALEALVSPEKRLYEEILASYGKGEYEKAIAGFRGFIKRYPESDLADNAQFWIGESYMSLKQYEPAILAFQEVVKKYPKGNKVPNACLLYTSRAHET